MQLPTNSLKYIFYVWIVDGASGASEGGAGSSSSVHARGSSGLGKALPECENLKAFLNGKYWETP